MADGTAKAVKYLWHAPFAHVFRDHCPLLYQIHKYWIPAPMHSAPQGCTLSQRAQGRTAFLEDSLQWRQYVEASHGQLLQILPQLDPYADSMLLDMNQTLLQAFHTSFPRHHQKQTAVWEQYGKWIHNKWMHRNIKHALMDKLHAGSLHVKFIFQFWYHHTRFHVLKKSHRRHALVVRNHRFQDIIQQAQRAADQHNSFQLFQLINNFAPRAPKRRMQLRTAQGLLATAVEEHAILCKFVSDVWSGKPLTDAHPNVIPGTPFSEADVQRAIAGIPLTKAVAPGFAPGVLWRSHSHILAPWLFRILQSWWFSPTPYVPDSWRHAWLCWLPKPGKSPTGPDALRPIALQDPVGKAIIGMISQIGQQDSLDSMVCWPLWAYLPHRSTQDSLLRVSQHCKAARRLMQSRRSTPHLRARRVPRTRLYGAVQLLVDMSRAFDSVDRNRLFHRLHTLGVRPEIVKILTCWHQHTCYMVQTGMQSTAIPVEKGVRQGCRAAPWLWNATMTMLVQDLSENIDPDWLRRCTNLYADDLQTGDLFESEQELLAILTRFAHILDLLSVYGFQINETKSQILITIAGPSSQQVKNRLFVRRHGTDMLLIENAVRSFHIPIAQSAKYLGAVVSYHNFEDCTTLYRIRLAEVAFQRLRKWLQGKHGLQIMDKLRLWHSCVKPIATYGFFCTGLTNKGIQLLHTMITKMMRKILQDHAYKTKHSNHHVFTEHGLDSPHLMLWHCGDRLLQSVSQRCLVLRPQDLVLTLDWSHLLDLQQQLMAHHLSGSFRSGLPTPSSEPTLRCHLCDFTTDSLTKLRQHCTIHHQLRLFRTQHVTPMDHMTHGLPQCVHCGRTFTTWRSHIIHIERGCQAFTATLPPRETLLQDCDNEMPLLPTGLTNAKADAAMRGHSQLSSSDLRNIVSQPWGHRLLQLVGSRQFSQLIHEDTINEYLSQRCCLCAQWVGRSQEMHRHMRLFHSAYWPMVMAKSSQLSNLYAGDSPCRFCRSVFKTSHACNTWTQISLLLIYGAGQLNESRLPPTSALQCEICDQLLPTAEQLHLHLVNDHNLATARWNPSRDSIDGGSGCAHCGMIFSTVESLRSHIAQGRCKCFDPAMTCEPKGLSDQIHKILCQGGLTEALQNSHWRLQMTLHCQNCTHVCTRAGDLMLHLRCSHPKLWQESAQLTSFLVGMYYPVWGCICNPTTAARRLNHVCVPLKQLSMQFFRLPPTRIFCPLLVTEQMLLSAYDQGIPRDLKFALDRSLISGDFSNLIQSKEWMSMLARRCLLCRQAFTPTDLGLHLREAHDCSTQLISFYVQQLLSAFLGHNALAHWCTHCDMIFDIPLHLQIGDGNDQTALADRALLAQNHFRAHCPAVLQLAIVLCRAQNHGRHHHDRQLGGLPTDPGGIPESGAVDGCQAGPRSETGTQSKSTETGQKRRRTGKAGDQAGGGPGRSSDDSHAHGTTPGQTRPIVAGGAERNSIPFLFQQQSSNRVIEVPIGGSGGVASDSHPAAPSSTMAAPEAAPVQRSPGGPADPIDTVGGIGSSVATGEGSLAEQRAPPGQDLPIPGVGHGSKEAGGEQTAGHFFAEDGSERSGAHRDEHGGELGSGLPCPTAIGGHDTMEADSQHEGRSGVWTSEVPMRLQHLGSHGDKPEGSHADTELPGHTADQVPQLENTEGPRQGQEEMNSSPSRSWDQFTRGKLIDVVAHAKMANPNNWCFANSALTAFLWCTLSLRDFDPSFWGGHCNTLFDFLMSLEVSTGDLSSETWFQDVLRCWGRLEEISDAGSISQHDAAEFISSWLHQLGTQPLDMRWERRMTDAAATHLIDESTATLPIFLQFSEVLTHIPRCTLTDLFKVWHEADGMVAALTHPSQAVCAHIDRCTQTAQILARCSTIIDPDAECVIPMFSHDDLRCEELEYSCVAMQSHLGTDRAGHYRTAIRIRPTVTRSTLPCAWLLCDDWAAPTPVWELPRWFLQNVTIMWLVRGDCHQLPEYADSVQLSAQPNAVDAMLALLPMPNT